MTEMISGVGQPTRQQDRVASLDVIRGFAILGILVLNIQTFAMPGAAYTNPFAYGDLTGVNYWVWYFSQVLFEMKFNTIFATLYGAGIAFLAMRSDDAGALRSRFYQRSFWLLAFGMIHAYFIWYGDILVNYAITGMLVFWARNWSAKTLFIVGFLLILLGMLITLGAGLSLPSWTEADRIDIANYWAPSQEVMEAEVAAYRGGLVENFMVRMPASVMMQTQGYLMLMLWRTAGLMMVGMALVKTGFLLGKLSTGLYVRCLFPGLLIGLPLIVWGTQRNIEAGFSFEYSMFFGMLPNLVGSLMLSLCYVSILILLLNSGTLTLITRSLGRVGQMALSNYLLQSIICTTIFYGFGFGLFGEVDRVGQAITTVSVWLFLAVFSKFWMARFRFGPFEWVWRSLTYRQRQALVKSAE